MRLSLLAPLLVALVPGIGASSKASNSPLLLWASDSRLFNNEQVDRKISFDEVFEVLQQNLAAAEASAPYLVIHMLPRGIKSEQILASEAQEATVAKILGNSFGSHLLFPNVTKPKNFDPTETWAELYKTLHIPQHQQDKKRLAILTNREVAEDTEAYKVVLPETSFVFDTLADRLGDCRIVLIEGGALLQSNGNDSSHWTILSALLGQTEKDILVISGDIDPPLPRKAGVRRARKPRRLQAEYNRAPAADVVLNVKPTQMAIFLFLGAFTFAIVSAVICTMQVNTPALYLEKTIPINKEF